MTLTYLSSAIPKNEYSTEELISIFPCELPEGVKENIYNLGVSKRYCIEHNYLTSTSESPMSENDLLDLCVEACKKTVENAALSINDIDYFVVAYDQNPILCPGLSQRLVREIGFNPYVRHVNVQGMACAALPKALELAENYLASHPSDSVLICISGVNSYWFHNQVQGLKNVMEISQINSIKDDERRLWELRKWIATMEYFLFGDGVASAIVAKEGEGLQVKKIVEATNLNKTDYSAGYARLSFVNEPFKFGFYSHLGKEIPKLGVEYTSAAMQKLLGQNAEATVKKAKKWVIHTGSAKILDLIAKHYEIGHEKLRESYGVLREYGNLAGASLPFILEKIISSNELSNGDIVLMLSYGWGFSASAAMLEYTK